ncbi:hypothetical protein LTR66_007555, partial [Elasticomyces elasticus]
MAKEDIRNARRDERMAAVEEEVHSLLSQGSAARDSSPENDIVIHKANSRSTFAPRRQSSFAQPRSNGAPRTPNRVRFDVDDGAPRERTPNGQTNAWIEEDYVSGANGDSGRRDSNVQRLPLLTDIEAPSVTVAADVDFSAEDLLESARPKSGMRSAFMNMANSIMWDI